MDYIVKQDPDVTVETKIQREGLCFFDVEKEPFQIYGVFRGFYSIAQAMAPVVEKNCRTLNVGDMDPESLGNGLPAPT